MVRSTCKTLNATTYKVNSFDADYLINISPDNEIDDIVKLTSKGTEEVVMDDHCIDPNTYHFTYEGIDYILVFKDKNEQGIYSIVIFKLDDGNVVKIQTVNSLCKILSFWIDIKSEVINLHLDTQYYSKTTHNLIDELITYKWNGEKFIVYSMER